METIFESDNIKIEKEKAMRRYNTFRKIANIVRNLEIIVGITLISISFSWISNYIPTVIEYSGVFLRRMTSLLFSPLFVFVIGNVIIITLFAKSSPSPEENSGDFLPEVSDVVTEVPAVEKVYRRSQSVSQTQSTAIVKVVDKKELRRSTTVPRRKLGSDDVAAKAKAIEEKRRKNCEEDDLSNDEFNRRVEEFIEKQRRFLNEESKILVLRNN